MTSAHPVDDPASKLNSLGQEIDDLRQSLRQTVVERSAKIGDRLITAKRIARHGQWLPWLHDRKMSERSAQNYMKMARKLHELGITNPKRVSDLVNMSYREALRATQEMEDAPPRVPVDELSTKRRFEQKRADEIGKLVSKLHHVAGRYGTGAVAVAQNAYEKPDSFRDISKNLGDLTARLLQRPKPLLVGASPDVAPVTPSENVVSFKRDEASANIQEQESNVLRDAWNEASATVRELFLQRLLAKIHFLESDDLTTKQKEDVIAALRALCKLDGAELLL